MKELFCAANWRTFKARVSEVPCPGAASSQQVALGGFTAAEGGASSGRIRLQRTAENDCEDLRASRLYSQTQSY